MIIIKPYTYNIIVRLKNLEAFFGKTNQHLVEVYIPASKKGGKDATLIRVKRNTLLSSINFQNLL